MNTPYSMALGWGSLLFAGGIAYYYAKKDINDRRDREHQKRLSHTSGVAMARHQASAGLTRRAEDPAVELSGITDQAMGGAPVSNYRLAKGNATEGRERGDRL